MLLFVIHSLSVCRCIVRLHLPSTGTGLCRLSGEPGRDLLALVMVVLHFEVGVLAVENCLRTLPHVDSRGQQWQDKRLLRDCVSSAQRWHVT